MPTVPSKPSPKDSVQILTERRRWSTVSCVVVATALIMGACVDQTGPPDPGPLAPGETVIEGRIQLPDEAQVSTRALRVISPAGTGSVNEDGFFSAIVDRSPRPTVLFFGDGGMGAQLLAVAIPGSEGPLLVTPTTIATTFVVLHPALAGAPVRELRRIADGVADQPGFGTLRARVEELLAHGADLTDREDLWRLAEMVLRGIAGGPAASAGKPAFGPVQNDRDPLVQRVGRDYRIQNPRPIYWGFQTRGVTTSDARYTRVRPAEFTWRFGWPFFRRSSVSTEHGRLDPGPYDAVLSRGSYTEDFTGRVNLEPLALNLSRILVKATAVFGTEIISDEACLAKALVDATAATIRTVERLWNRSQVDHANFILLVNEVFRVASESACLSREMAREWSTRSIRMVSSTLNAVGKGAEAYELGQVIAAMFDPVSAEEIALLDSGDGFRMTTAGAAIIDSDPPAADVYVGGELVGSAPAYIMNRGERTLPFRLRADGYHVATGSVNLAPGRWAVARRTLERDGRSTATQGTLSLDGIDDWASTASIRSLGVGRSITVEARIRLTRDIGATQARILNRQSTGTGLEGWGLELIGAGFSAGGIESGQELVFHANSCSTASVVRGGINIRPGRWYHVAGVRDGNILRLYMDGRLVAEQVVSGSRVCDPTGVPMVAGKSGALAEFYFPGEIDELRVWATARTEAELARDASDANPAAPGLLAYWPFDDADARVKRDVTGHGYDLTVRR